MSDKETKPADGVMDIRGWKDFHIDEKGQAKLVEQLAVLASMTSKQKELVEMLSKEIGRLQTLVTAQQGLLDFYNDEDKCSVEFDTQELLDEFLLAQTVCEAAQAAKGDTE